MSWLKPFVAWEQPFKTINRWLNTVYCVVLLALAMKIGFSWQVLVLSIGLVCLQLGHPWRLGPESWTIYRLYLLLSLELAGLILWSQRAATDWASNLFVLYTASVMINYPAAVSFPFIFIGYSLYLVFFDDRPFSVSTYLVSLLNFSATSASIFGLRVLLHQRQQILDLNQRLQSQAALTAEMSKLRERNSLAEALHDTMGHTLTSSIVSLEGATLLLEKRPTEAVTLLDSVREQLQTSLGDIRQTVRTLKTDILADHTTLKESLQQLVERVGRQTPVAIDLQNQLTVDLLPIQEYVLYTIVQESITNALKHSQATQMQITLAELADNRIALTITDNGAGTSSFAPGFGLTHLVQKVQALGGTLTIATEVQAGFKLHAVLPLALESALQPLPSALGKAKAYD